MQFKDLNLIDPLLGALAQEKYDVPTPIQAQAIPHLLQGKDLLGIAQTGTGKTAAFVLPLLQHLWTQRKAVGAGSPRGLIIAPTRELAAQIGDSIQAYGRNLHLSYTVIFGGVSQYHQVQSLRRGVDIIVATPGRLMDLMQQGYIHLDRVEVVVLDEADRMLDMGFVRDVRKILAKLPVRRQSIFLSATMSPEILSLAKTMLRDPVKVEVTPQATTVEKTEQAVLYVDRERKAELLIDLLSQKHLERVLVFTRTKHAANKLTKKLLSSGIRADAIHGNKSQGARVAALAGFKSGKTRVLVATDIAARGIDIDSISHVINFEIPNESESYVHRIGRTARAGAEGTAYSLCAPDERSYFRAIERLTRQQIPVMEHSFMSSRSHTSEHRSHAAPHRQPQHARSHQGRKFRR